MTPRGATYFIGGEDEQEPQNNFGRMGDTRHSVSAIYSIDQQDDFLDFILYITSVSVLPHLLPPWLLQGRKEKKIIWVTDDYSHAGCTPQRLQDDKQNDYRYQSTDPPRIRARATLFNGIFLFTGILSLLPGYHQKGVPYPVPPEIPVFAAPITAKDLSIHCCSFFF